MKKINIVIMTALLSMSTFTNATNESEYKHTASDLDKTIIQNEKNGNSEVSRTVKPNIEKKASREECYKEAYKQITDINKILDNSSVKGPEEALFNKIKSSNLWNSLNKENKEIFAKKIIKWTMEGDAKINEMKTKITKYYIDHCDKK